MRKKDAIISTIILGFLFGFIDALSMLIQYNHFIAKILYYIGIDGSVLFISFIIGKNDILKIIASWITITAFWNLLYYGLYVFTGHYGQPIDLGLGQIITFSYYQTVVFIQLIGSFIAWGLVHLLSFITEPTEANL